jgi:hypothetical protein
VSPRCARLRSASLSEASNSAQRARDESTRFPPNGRGSFGALTERMTRLEEDRSFWFGRQAAEVVRVDVMDTDVRHHPPFDDGGPAGVQAPGPDTSGALRAMKGL